MAVRSLSVLVVDDFFYVRKHIRQQLQELGHESEEAGSAQEALLFMGSCKYDLLVVGHLAGEGSSVRLVSYLRCREDKKHPLPIVVVTDSIHTSEFTRTMSAGADGYFLFDRYKDDLQPAIEKITKEDVPTA